MDGETGAVERIVPHELLLPVLLPVLLSLRKVAANE